jgi:hypothetical protein
MKQPWIFASLEREHEIQGMWYFKTRIAPPFSPHGQPIYHLMK